ncbi:hypothetical protein AVEN_34385-1 [Araneus ventricosus]|uniref:Tc1-like transposase DDE domain-containing protein n=1 Tax=Araneus ventricosus TaxID=182803 RepID=A0A4Y2G2X0_ARAVE|nr:hypothetical protein AVEN_34385-1 [Araneus ventricosus]
MIISKLRHQLPGFKIFRFSQFYSQLRHKLLSANSAQNVHLWLLYNCPIVIKTPPDLNPIENVWDELEKRTRKHDISSREQLKAVLTEERNKIEHSYTKKLVESDVLKV